MRFKKRFLLIIILVFMLSATVFIAIFYPQIKFLTTDSCAYKSYLRDTIYDDKGKVKDFVTEIPLQQNYDFQQLENQAFQVGYRVRKSSFDHPPTEEESRILNKITKHYYKSQDKMIFTDEQDKENIYEIEIEQNLNNSTQTIKVTMTGKKACSDSESNNRNKTKILLSELGIENEWIDKTDINDFMDFSIF